MSIGKPAFPATRRLRATCLCVTTLVVATLSACGGDDDVSGAPPSISPPEQQTPPEAQAACRPAGKFSYSGSASTVTANGGELALVVVPTLPDAYAKHRHMTAAHAPVSSQVQQSSGAFTTLASSAAASDCLGMDHGAITEIQGIGSDVAIGRWNQAMDTDGNTYRSDQGVGYAVGTPLKLAATSGTLACMPTIYTAVANGTGALPGTLATGSATLNPATQSLEDLSLTVTISGKSQTLTRAQAPLNAAVNDGLLHVQSVVVGHDATQPLVAIGYSAPTSSEDGIGGIVVMSCR